MTQSIFITGASSGLGHHTAVHFAKQGWNVAATMREPERETGLAKHEHVRLFKLDVTDPAQVRAAAGAAIDAFGKIDVVVNNAGAGAYGPLEFAEEQTIDWQFAVNVRGPINVIRAFLPHFRERKGGRFINISSLMGVMTVLPTGSLYNMSKFALEGLTEGLYYELKPFNIDLHLVEPGGFKGNRFIEKVVFNTHPDIKDYDPLIGKVNALMRSSDEQGRDDPQLIVDEIEALATGRSRRFRTLVGKAGQDLMAMRASMPIEDYLSTIAKNFA
jgi:NAD(P)-dependent dehydrogenase (short-subunit alcohol dehydrogenase family)